MGWEGKTTKHQCMWKEPNPSFYSPRVCFSHCSPFLSFCAVTQTWRHFASRVVTSKRSPHLAPLLSWIQRQLVPPKHWYLLIYQTTWHYILEITHFSFPYIMYHVPCLPAWLALLPWGQRQQVPLKHWYTPITSQTPVILIFTVVRTWNLM
jgi:hypothetical protein